MLYFILNELYDLYKNGPYIYFTAFWNYIEWLLIICSISAFILFYYRLSWAYRVLDFFKKTRGYGYIKLQRIAFWNQMLTIFLASSCALSTLRFLKLFRFYKKIYALALTLDYCIRELMGFAIMFFFVWVAFVQMMYLYFFDKLESYANPFKAFTTSFECLIGKFDKNLMLSTNYAVGPFIFTFYPIVMGFMMVNIFITMVCEAFKTVRLDIKMSEDEFRISHIVKKLIGFVKQNKQLEKSKDYMSHNEMFAKKIDELLDHLTL